MPHKSSQDRAEYKRQWYQKNKDRIKEQRREQQKKAREQDPDRFRQYSRKWRENNPNYAKEYYRANKPEHQRRSREYKLKTQYGMTLEQYNELLESQGGGCWVCRSTDRLVVDHCHISGIVRGILCNSCNTGLGMLGDAPERISRMLEYLECARLNANNDRRPPT